MDGDDNLEVHEPNGDGGYINDDFYDEVESDGVQPNVDVGYSNDHDIYESSSNESSHGDSYKNMLEEFGHLWLATLVNHDISMSAASYLWKLAFSWIPKIIQQKHDEQVTRKTPQFPHLRRKLLNQLVPPVWICAAYFNLETNEVIKPAASNVAHEKKFNDINKFKKLYEITSVSIKDVLLLHQKICSNHQVKYVDLSCDGVASSRHFPSVPASTLWLPYDQRTKVVSILSTNSLLY